MAGIGKVRTPSTHKAYYVLVIVSVLTGMLTPSTQAEAVVAWDFTQGLQGWRGNQYTQDLTATAEGLAFRSTGIDPWIEGPAVDLAGSRITRVRVRMKSQADAHGELFYGPTFQAGRSVRFTIVNDGQWHEYPLIIREPLGAGTRFRLDPATSEGQIVVASIQVETLPPPEPPQFKPPEKPDMSAQKPEVVRSGELSVEHYGRGWGDFVFKVDGEPMATGYRDDQIGILLDGQTHWLQLREAQSRVYLEGSTFACHIVLTDSAGGRWQIWRYLRPIPREGMITVQVTVIVDKDRDVVYFPWLTLFPGLGTFGEHKTQGLFAGLEYLEDEPSSSEADITTPEHVRRCPDPVKITFPLMAITHGGRYIGLTWPVSDMIAPVFDSPDRIYRSGAHVMALTLPAVGEKRFENDLVAHTPFRLRGTLPKYVETVVLGGKGDTVVDAVQKYIEEFPLPDVPSVEGGFDAAVTLLSHGWLDSTINEGGLFRHAVWGESFKAGPAGDAIMYMDWLANRAKDSDLVRRLIVARDQAITKMPADQPYMSGISHTRTPTAPFVFGGVVPYVARRQADAESLLARFDDQGIKRYRPGDVDYGKTHFTNHANGFAAPEVANILEAATLSADADLIRNGLALLDKQTSLYRNTVPRGAQTWEVPLHTPDILASAYLVKAYTLGYILSGRQEHLEQARYWAWTGVPFIYLVNPTQGEVGTYATIAVLGATNWKSPSWFGQPVQWCGLVYGSALHLLSQYDREGPWAKIAKGITAAGLQMTWPTSDEKRQGLLPDFFHLRAQISDGPAINPGTVQAHLPELFGTGTLYDLKRLPKQGWLIHAPCAIRDLRETQDAVTFTVDGWNAKPFYVLIAGVEKPPAAITVRSDNAEPKPASTQFHAQQGLLTITLNRPCEIRVQF